MSGIDGFAGAWDLAPEQSGATDRFGVRRLEITVEDGGIEVRRLMPGGRFSDVLRGVADGRAREEPSPAGIVADTVYAGIYRCADRPRTITCVAGRGGRGGAAVDLREEFPAATSQGVVPIAIEHHWELSDDGARLVYRTRREAPSGTRESGGEFSRAGGRLAWFMELGANWEIGGDLPTHALLVSLQGLANRRAPRLYFVYPPGWDFRFTPHVLTFLKEQRGFAFGRLSTAGEALSVFRSSVRGYVVWDREVRTSLIVAFTIAGVEDAVVVSEDLVPLVRALGIPEAADLRGTFRGMSDLAIYEWAFERYRDRTSRERIVWLGGEHGAVMKPGVADWGVREKAFFTDLSTRKTDRGEYDLARKLLAGQTPGSLVFGWHSYRKDLEGEHVTLTSSFGLRMEGLHSLPNLSFMHQVPPSEGWQFRNNHTVRPGQRVACDEKVYIACVQTDCLGLGGWTEPGRGDMPYAWEVTMNWVWLCPAMLEYFFSQATPNDYFIGALGGPGYVYPKAVPPARLPGLIAQAWELMQTLDLTIFDIADFSEGEFLDGNIDLPRGIVDAFYEGMPGAAGFVNGYGPAHTFALRGRRPFISFDYYLAPERSEEECAADIRELASLNARRPYHLLVHVRNFSDISRVKRILDRLPREEYEVVALDTLVAMAAERWTFRESFLDGQP